MKNKKWFRVGVSVAAAATVAFAAVTGPGCSTVPSGESGAAAKPKTNNNLILAAAAYPEMAQYPDAELEFTDFDKMEEQLDAWRSSLDALRDQPEGYMDGYDEYFAKTLPTFLADADGENRVYSPLSLYLALAMSAEISDGNTRQQFLDALAQKDIQTLRAHAKSIWEANFVDDGMARCVLGNSLWTNSKATYNQDTMESLAKNYYASAFTGDPESDEYNKYFKEWLNKQTGEQLSDFIGGLELDPQMLLTIASTVNYMGKWNYPFSKENTSSETFHAPSGDKECEFMKETMDLSYAWSDKFASIALSLENNGSMRFLLPDEGVSIEELMQDEAAVALLEGKYSRDFRAPETTQKPYDTAYVKVNMSIPKFDLSSTIDLKDNLKQMGITDAFDGTIADFTPLGDDTKGTFLSEALQSSRVAIDEAGCTASSLTVMMYAGAAMPTDEVDFVLDRPFVFEIMGETGLPLFVGVVNQI